MLGFKWDERDGHAKSLPGILMKGDGSADFLNEFVNNYQIQSLQKSLIFHIVKKVKDFRRLDFRTIDEVVAILDHDRMILLLAADVDRFLGNMGLRVMFEAIDAKIQQIDQDRLEQDPIALNLGQAVTALDMQFYAVILKVAFQKIG